MLSCPFIDGDFNWIAAIGSGAANQSKHGKAKNAGYFTNLLHGFSL
jgi:hypothetical protein